MKEVTYEKIIEIVQTQVRDKIITSEQYNEDLNQLGMDSLKFIQIVVAFEEEFECEIPDAKLILSEMDTINKMYSVLKNNAINMSQDEA